MSLATRIEKLEEKLRPKGDFRNRVYQTTIKQFIWFY